MAAPRAAGPFASIYALAAVMRAARLSGGNSKALSMAPNPPSEWVTTAVPELRIVDNKLWNQVKARQQEMRRVASNGDRKGFNQARRPRYLFSRLTKYVREINRRRMQTARYRRPPTPN